MTYLLDISTLIAGLWQNHPANAKTSAWLQGKKVATCPLSELGFLLISSEPKGPVGATLADCQQLLRAFTQSNNCMFVPDDISGLEASPKTGKGLTDAYLAELAARHSMRLATLDAGIKHSAAELIV